jgi:hypothetical protein
MLGLIMWGWLKIYSGSGQSEEKIFRSSDGGVAEVAFRY